MSKSPVFRSRRYRSTWKARREDLRREKTFRAWKVGSLFILPVIDFFPPKPAEVTRAYFQVVRDEEDSRGLTPSTSLVPTDAKLGAGRRRFPGVSRSIRVGRKRRENNYRWRVKSVEDHSMLVIDSSGGGRGRRGDWRWGEEVASRRKWHSHSGIEGLVSRHG